jgi:hypothetical protein
LTGTGAPTTATSWGVPEGTAGAEKYQAAQGRLVKELRSTRIDSRRHPKIKETMAVKIGDVWRVRDLVTLGSPLTYARFLLAGDGKALLHRQVLRELPNCPPTKDQDPDERGQKSFVFSYEAMMKADWAIPNSVVPDHAAPFLLTRWTNLYFPQDPIGGPLQPIFGWGIRDVEVKIDGEGAKNRCFSYWGRYVLDHFFGGAHIRYWELINGEANIPASVACAKELRKIVRED